MKRNIQRTKIAPRLPFPSCSFYLTASHVPLGLQHAKERARVKATLDKFVMVVSDLIHFCQILDLFSPRLIDNNRGKNPASIMMWTKMSDAFLKQIFTNYMDFKTILDLY